jgi:hypothetical protein
MMLNYEVVGKWFVKRVDEVMQLTLKFRHLPVQKEEKHKEFLKNSRLLDPNSKPNSPKCHKF